MTTSYEELLFLIKSRVKCIWITSFEESRVIEDIEKILRSISPDTGLRIWSIFEGLKTKKLDNPQVAVEKKLANPNVFFDYMESTLNTKDNSDSFVWILKDFHYFNDKPTQKRAIRDLMEYQQKNYKYNPIIAISPFPNIPAEFEKLFTVIDYDLLKKEEIKNIIVASLPDFTEQENLVNAAAQACEGLTLIEIRNALSKSLRKTQTLDSAILKEEKIGLIKKSGVLDYRIPDVTLDQLGGNALFKEWLKEIKLTSSEEARKYGIKRSKGYLCFGPPGTSKTVAAEIVANELGYPFLVFNSSKIMQSTVGSSERNMAQALKVIKSCAPCVVLFDECEKLFGGCQSSNSSDSGTLNRVLAQLLQVLCEDDNGIFTIMTSNDVSQLPPELTRSGRLDTQWFFDIPTVEEQKEIFKIHLDRTGKKYNNLIINEAIRKTADFTGAEIEEAVKVALRKSFIRQTKDNDGAISKQDLLAAIETVVPIIRSSKEKIYALRQYAKTRAKKTSLEAEEQEAFPGFALDLS